MCVPLNIFKNVIGGLAALVAIVFGIAGVIISIVLDFLIQFIILFFIAAGLIICLKTTGIL